MGNARRTGKRRFRHVMHELPVSTGRTYDSLGVWADEALPSVWFYRQGGEVSSPDEDKGLERNKCYDFSFRSFAARPVPVGIGLG